MALSLTPESLSSSAPLDQRSTRRALLRRYLRLEADRSSWRAHWSEISDYILPRRGRFLITGQQTRGRRRNTKIIDSTGGQALRTMTAGMMSGMTSPARPWFRLSVQDPALKRRYDVRVWLTKASEACAHILLRSNFYTAIPTVYEELGAFGTGPLYRQPSADRVIRFRPFTAGEYVIAEDDQGRINTLARHYTMTVAQVVEKFVKTRAHDDGEDERSDDWAGVSTATKRLWDRGDYDSLVPIVHMIAPRGLWERDPRRMDQKNKPFRSVYVEHGQEAFDEVLFDGGYSKFPAYIPRWDVLGGDVYGRCPGMETLPDIKQLQHQQKRKAQAIDKLVNPPMVASVSLRGRPTSVLPGSNTYVDPSAGSQGFTPAYQVQPRLNEMMVDIREVQERIQRGFYADLFAMMINSDRRQMTATEVAERHEEKLVLLGPVLQRLNTELFDPLIEDVLDMAMKAGLVEQPPAALQGADVEITYVSLLAQAMQAVGATSIERVMSFAGNLSSAFPEVLDLPNEDKALRRYADIMGLDPDLLNSEEEVSKVRKQRSDEAAAAQEMAMAQEQAATVQAGAGAAQSAASAAKVLSETDSTSPNALTQMLSGIGPGGPDPANAA